MNIKDMVKDNKQVTFDHYRDGDLFYKTECGFMFPVPVSDVGNATMLKQDKALHAVHTQAHSHVGRS